MTEAPLTGDQVISDAVDFAARCERTAQRSDVTPEAKAEWLRLAELLRQLVIMADLQTVAVAYVETGVIRVGVH
jgi:hypothetical protein